MTDEPRHDRFGRYLLPDPDTGEERAWTRATTVAKAMDDTYNLERWKMRMVAKGVAMREDLRVLAKALPLDTGKKQLNEVARDALEAAQASRGRNLGNALHLVTAQVDRGEPADIDPPFDRDLAAYEDTLDISGIIRRPSLVERIVCLPDLDIAGQFDRIVEWPPELFIADLKTGDDLELGWLAIAVQLAIYAHAEWMWDGEQWRPMPKVNQESALVIHLPVGKATCELHWVDLEIGWEAALMCVDIRTFRTRKDIARPFGTDVLGRAPVQPVLNLGSPPADEDRGGGRDREAVAAPTPAGGSDIGGKGGSVWHGGQETPPDAPPILMVPEPGGPPHA